MGRQLRGAVLSSHAAPHWYPIGTMTRIGVPVVISWGWFEGPAVLLRDAKRKTLYWATYRDGKVVKLPERNASTRDWPTEPVGWRPGADWTGPLPQPLPFQTPPRAPQIDPSTRAHPFNNASADGLNASNADFTGALNPSSGPEPISRTPWWHEPRPIWHADNARHAEAVEYRLLRAVAQVDDIGAPGLARQRPLEAFKTTEEATADMGRTVLNEIAPRFRPVPSDLSDFDTAMAWFVALNPPEHWADSRRVWSLSNRQWAVFYRSRSIQYTYGEIADRLKLRSKQRARYYYDDAIKRCHAIANGKRAFKWIDPKESIRAVQDGNRAYRRQRPDTAMSGGEVVEALMHPRPTSRG